MSFFIYLDTGRAPEHARIQAVHGCLGGVADLHDEFAIARKLDRLPVGGPISRDPDVAACVDEDAVFRSRPVIAGTRAAPRFRHVAGAVEFQNRRRSKAALRDRRGLGRRKIIFCV